LAVLAVVLAGCVAAGVVARFLAPPELWLDEAQSVAIARLPLPELFAALEQDGSPPLYYLLLHGWTAVFGTSATAVRALSAGIGVLTLPLAWHVARRLAGRRVAVALVVLLATSPFLIRYSSETRMYALLVLLTVLGAAAGAAVLRRPGPGPVLGLGAVTGALLLTHVWAFHVVAVAGVLALAALRYRRAAALRVLAALAVGGLLYTPWVLSLLVQLAHTGTPWAAPPGFAVLPMALEAWRGGFQVRDHVLGTALLLLAALGLLAAPAARRPGARTVLLSLPPRPSRAVLLALSLGTLLVAGAVSRLTGTAVADRYTSVAVLAFLVLAALGVAVPARCRGAGRRARAARRPRAGDLAAGSGRPAHPGGGGGPGPRRRGARGRRRLLPRPARALGGPAGPAGAAAGPGRLPRPAPGRPGRLDRLRDARHRDAVRGRRGRRAAARR
jgi:uncharacterized membrane protein